MKRVLCTIFVFMSGTTTAQQNCLDIPDKDKRLDCYDKALNYKPPPVPPEVPKPLPWINVIAREKAEFSNFAGADLGSKAAQLGLQRTSGKDSSTVRLGVIASLRPVNDLGWQPFGAVAWNRDTSVAAPKDIRDFTAGITGPLWDAASFGWTVFPTIRVTRRVDILGSGDGTSMGVHVNVVKLSWVNSTPSALKNSYQFVPQFGVSTERRQSTPLVQGTWTSAYAGATLSAQLGGILPRLTSSATYRKFNDQAVPIGNGRRAESYSNVSFEYALTDPEDKSATVRPSLTLSRETGADLLYGGTSVNRTFFGLSLRVN